MRPTATAATVPAATTMLERPPSESLGCLTCVEEDTAGNDAGNDTCDAGADEIAAVVVGSCDAATDLPSAPAPAPAPASAPAPAPAPAPTSLIAVSTCPTAASLSLSRAAEAATTSSASSPGKTISSSSCGRIRPSVHCISLELDTSTCVGK